MNAPSKVRRWVLLFFFLSLIGLLAHQREQLSTAYHQSLSPWLRPDEGDNLRHWRAATQAPFVLAYERRQPLPDQWRRPLVALTFDDGPYPLYTPLLLEVLKQHQVKATFFLVGRSVEQQPELARRVARDGHELANHTYTHRRESDMQPAEFKEDLLQAEAAIARVTGVRVHLVRPAGGSVSSAGREVLRELGYTSVDWTVNPGDWWIRDPQELLKGSFRGRSREGIVLLHSGSKGIIEALPVYIEQMRQKGFRFVTISELVAACEYPLPVSPRLEVGEHPGRSAEELH